MPNLRYSGFPILPLYSFLFCECIPVTSTSISVFLVKNLGVPDHMDLQVVLSLGSDLLVWLSGADQQRMTIQWSFYVDHVLAKQDTWLSHVVPRPVMTIFRQCSTIVWMIIDFTFRCKSKWTFKFLFFCYWRRENELVLSELTIQLDIRLHEQ